MVLLYRVFGILYLVSGAWCSLQVLPASMFLGFSLEMNKGLAEFFSVYGGLQVGLGLAMLATSFKPRYLEASIYFSAIFSSSLAFFRSLSFVIYGVIDDFFIMLVLEIVIAATLWMVWSKIKQSSH